ncbi:hypothetical protein RUM43_011581 [Polyplax serrata]|uniref:Uncharacterized protein n=1 Tax=Polyplax serrata TaxID=468196 RepID=A0AAN8NYD7_POLSC
MEGTIISIACFLTVLAFAGSQAVVECDSAFERLIDPLLVRTLKSVLPKKYSTKLGQDKDLVMQAKYKLASKLLARHLKNVNSGNYETQNFMYQTPQSMGLQLSSGKPSMCAQQEQAAAAAAAAAANIQIPFDSMRAISSGYPRMIDQQIQQAMLHQPGPFRCNGCLRMQQILIPNGGGLTMQN